MATAVWATSLLPYARWQNSAAGQPPPGRATPGAAPGLADIPVDPPLGGDRERLADAEGIRARSPSDASELPPTQAATGVRVARSVDRWMARRSRGADAGPVSHLL
jgi:hypothetical protein